MLATCTKLYGWGNNDLQFMHIREAITRPSCDCGGDHGVHIKREVWPVLFG
jgi:hypothetical protein